MISPVDKATSVPFLLDPVHITEEELGDDGSRSYTCGVSKLFFNSLSWYRQDKGASTFHRLGLESFEDDAGTSLQTETLLWLSASVTCR